MDLFSKKKLYKIKCPYSKSQTAKVIEHPGHEDEHYWYCSKCGSKDVYEDDNFCSYCGVRFVKND